MKQCILFFSLILLFLGCQEDEYPSGTLTLSTEMFDADNQRQVLKVAIKTNQDWVVEGATDWCLPDKLSGSGNDSLFININENDASQQRNAILTVRTQDLRKSIRISQGDIIKNYHYKLPVIFHILYNNLSVPEQNLSAQFIYNILDQCNAMYADSIQSVDCNLEFIPATHDPQGNLLAEAGINRIRWSSDITMDCNVFMKNKSLVSYIWDLNNYINIFVYSFSNKNVLGISYLPYTLSNNPLEGLDNGDGYLIEPELEHPHCLSINNKFALTEHPILKVPDMVLTLTHELGHYLGLFHVFTDAENPESDYCDDTETYDWGEYISWLNSLAIMPSFEELASRTTPDGKKFVSYNIMDYDYSYLSQFTPDQRYRIRHVLENSPLVPGPKLAGPRTRSNPNLEKPEARTIE